jgi:hypothetical protein
LRILIVGGQRDEGESVSEIFPACHPDDAEPASIQAQIFEFNVANPSSSVWRAPLGGQPSFRRFMGDTTLLPDGNVLVVNGAQRGKADCSFDAVQDAEMFDSVTEKWSTVARTNRPRLYHGTALLLPDANILIAGNTEHWNPGNPVEDGTLEVFRPAYAFKQTSRPAITHLAQSTMGYGRRFTIHWTSYTVPRPQIDRVVLMRPSSVTHTNNMDQRLIQLHITAQDDATVTVTGPESGTVAPPGFYMLFLISADGFPSQAEWLLLR